VKRSLLIPCSVVVLAVIVGSFASFTGAWASSDLTRIKNTQADTISSSVTIRWVPEHTAFKGRVRSPADECIQDRLVSVFRVRRGADEAIGNDYTGGRGRWVVDVRRAHGRYYAKVPSWGIPYSTTLCGAAKSQTVRVG
jgi:hypothetical protein